MAKATISDVIRQATADYMAEGGTIYALARDTGMDVASLHRWWHEKSDIRASTIDALAAHLGITAKQTRRRKKTAS